MQVRVSGGIRHKSKNTQHHLYGLYSGRGIIERGVIEQKSKCAPSQSFQLRHTEQQEQRQLSGTQPAHMDIFHIELHVTRKAAYFLPSLLGKKGSNLHCQ